jgi:carbamoyl-phosphate synthase small subunit
MSKAYLILSNKQKLIGEIYNYDNTSIKGEVVFNTGMTGYEETLTDPSYAGQILVFTYPLLGNYGVGKSSGWESAKIHAKAVICSNLIGNTKHHKCEHSLLHWLKQQGTPLLTGIDTRELTKILRDNGTMYASISDLYEELPTLNEVFTDLVAKTSCTGVKYHGKGKYKLLLVDFGVKQNIIRSLLDFDVTVKQVPFNYDYRDESYDGILLSNGPGNPKSCSTSIAILHDVLKTDKPIFGICLGSQLLGLAAGADTYKLKFGHRGHNQPCQDMQTQRCYLTSQNHGYAICHGSLPEDWEISFTHLHDGSIAGIKHKTKPHSAVQFHPEAAAGPHDTNFLFQQFFEQVILKACKS